MGDRRPVVALPETRHLDVLANLLERRQFDVVRCPLIAIKDAPERDPVVAWLERFCAGEMDLAVIYTGEGVRRLMAVARAVGLEQRFVSALESTPLLTRGPKPARELGRVGVKPTYPALAPTTAGVIETLAGIELEGRRVGIQLYGAEPLPELTGYLESRGARPDCVSPYVYASKVDDEEVEALIAAIAGGRVDAIAFTSKSQVERLRQVEARHGGEGLAALLAPLVVAAVGPVAAMALEEISVRVDVVPESDYFMKPMVGALLQRFETQGVASGDAGDP